LGLEPNRFVEWLLRVYHYLPGGGDKLRPLRGMLLPRRYARRLGEVTRAPEARQ
jgi:hypothetical protein